jgi:hypothetical protein
LPISILINSETAQSLLLLSSSPSSTTNKQKPLLIDLINSLRNSIAQIFQPPPDFRQQVFLENFASLQQIEYQAKEKSFLSRDATRSREREEGSDTNCTDLIKLPTPQ